MKWGLLLCAGVGLTACTAGAWKPGPVRTTAPLIERGWSYVESEKEAVRMEAGTRPVSYGGPVIVDEKIVVGSERFGLSVLAKRSGQLLWARRFKDEVATLPYVHESKVFVATDAGEVREFDLSSGRELWFSDLGVPVHGSMVMAFDRLFLCTADEGIHALDPATGKVLWSYRRPSFSGTGVRGGGHPSVIGGKIWTGFSDGALVSLDPQTGALLSEKIFRDNLKFMDLDAKVIGWRDGLLVSTYDGKLRHLKLDGTLLWEFPAGGARAPLLTEGDLLYLPSSDGHVYAIQGTNGKEVWRYPLRRGVPTSVSLVRKENASRLLVAGSDEKLLLLDAATGKALAETSFGRGSGSYAPIAVDQDSSSFYLLSSYSRVYQFRLNL